MADSVSWHSAHKLALSLPEAEERDHFGCPSFRVNGKIFAQLSAEQEEECRALVKLSSADQVALTMSDPSTFSSAPHWGHRGWGGGYAIIDELLTELQAS